MNRYHGQRCLPAGLLAPAVVCALCACSKAVDMPAPASPPRPLVISGYVFTAQLDVAVRPAPAPPGQM